MRVQSGYLQKRIYCPSKVSWLLSDNNISDNGLSLAVSVAINEQISEVIPMLGNNAILTAY